MFSEIKNILDTIDTIVQVETRKLICDHLIPGSDKDVSAGVK